MTVVRRKIPSRCQGSKVRLAGDLCEATRAQTATRVYSSEANLLKHRVAAEPQVLPVTLPATGGT